ncbi:hypothetical protein ACHMW6_00105 (plasmid) [Pseudoduganella sp. UC29_106]|uniref:hypothetical protein n=1 Tax=Pseudoduganella sp. UC29_106 TaxID=3374553 RepID=UPI003756809A
MTQYVKYAHQDYAKRPNEQTDDNLTLELNLAGGKGKPGRPRNPKGAVSAADRQKAVRQRKALAGLVNLRANVPADVKDALAAHCAEHAADPHEIVAQALRKFLNVGRGSL